MPPRAQRRALRVLYRTCALCDVPFEHTQAHHVSWYGFQQGLTDIDNLLPLCNRHHREQHTMNELAFWKQNNIDPFMLAITLRET